MPFLTVLSFNWYTIHASFRFFWNGIKIGYLQPYAITLPDVYRKLDNVWHYFLEISNYVMWYVYIIYFRSNFALCLIRKNMQSVSTMRQIEESVFLIFGYRMRQCGMIHACTRIFQSRIICMMTSRHGKTYRVTCHLWGKSTSYR